MTTRTKDRFPAVRRNASFSLPFLVFPPPKPWAFFRQADVLANYLREFGKGQEDAGRIVYNINVDRIDQVRHCLSLPCHRLSPPFTAVPLQVDGGGFQVHVTDNRTESAGQAVIECQVVVSAVGMGLTNIPPGLDYPGKKWPQSPRIVFSERLQHMMARITLDSVPGVIDYGDLPDAEETEAVFENKSVAVFGMVKKTRDAPMNPQFLCPVCSR